uniref:Global nitrogen transcriptional regulator n=1 Tax=Liagora harveyana TaxID=406718 RepID=A0A1G4NVG7_9FLOR|nr:Global nitrogen transcriptional regulator [Liagora harveyana]SCW22662.1 Global nitrogen transcriptional regulator [Liagora harveyana]
MNKHKMYHRKPSIHKLEPGDVLIIYPNDKNIYIIAQGILIMSRLFSNGERFSSDLIHTGYMIKDMFKNNRIYNYCYEMTAVSPTYIINISKRSEHSNKQYGVDHYHNKTLPKTSFSSLWAQKNIRNRIIHLLLILSEITGYEDNYSLSINIDLQLSYQLIATITGSTRNTVSKMIKQMEKDNIIVYNNKKIIIYDLLNLNKYSTSIISK